MGKALDLTGQRYGRLVAVENTGRKNLRNFIWKFRCDCGNKVDLPSGEVRRGNVKSCGCYAKEVAAENMRKIGNLGAKATTTHGMTKTPTFISWDSMRQRCLNSKHKSYSDYGGRGIKICDRWLKSFESFFADMGERPPDMTLDRIDFDGDYEPENCRWATPEQQGNNKRTSLVFEIDGRTQTAIQWAREYGIGPKTLLYRLKHGVEIKEALTMSVNHGNKFGVSGVGKL